MSAARAHVQSSSGKAPENTRVQSEGSGKGTPKVATPFGNVKGTPGVTNGKGTHFNGVGNGQTTTVQTIFIRFPGQSTGQYVLAEVDSQGRPVKFVSTNKEKDLLARLSWLLIDAGTTALRTTFDSVHPPLNLRSHLTQQHVRSVLQRLQQQGVFSDKQWQLLYPSKKKHTSSQKYDSRTLITLLEAVCHLCPPYPNGWTSLPLPTDSSLSADIVRLQLLYQQISSADSLTVEQFSGLWKQAHDVLLRLGGPPMRMKLTRIEQELISPELQDHYIQQLREHWGNGTSSKLSKVHALGRKSNRSRRSYTDSKANDYEGLPPEDKAVLMKTYKTFIENIVAEDILDRLQQSQVIKFSDRQEILSLPKNPERMQHLLDKVMNTKLSYAFKALCDAIKFKYKKIHENVMQIRKQIYKEGIVNTVDVVRVSHDALVNHYKTRFSRCHPFPWNEKLHASIRDIYSPLDILDTDGKRLHTADLLPAYTGNGRGQRILLEGQSGSGKSVFSAWLTYMWATQVSSFKNQYPLMVYVDAQSLRGSNLETAIYDDLFPEKFKLGVGEFWAMLEDNSQELLLIIDGVDQTEHVDLRDLLSGAKLRQSTVIVTADPNKAQPASFTPDTKWFIFGFNEHNIRRCLKSCIALSRHDQDHFEKFFAIVNDESWEFRQHMHLPQVTVLVFAVYNFLRRSAHLKEMKTLCDLLEKYSIAMATRFCKSQKIDIIGFEFPEEVNRSLQQLDAFAFKYLLDGKSEFVEEDVMNFGQNPIVFKMGAFLRFTSNSKMRFWSSLQQDFLTAKHLADMALEEMEKVKEEEGIFRHPRYSQVVSFLCGLYRNDVDTPVLKTLFTDLATRNARCIHGHHVGAMSVSSDHGGRIKTPRGDIADFRKGLQSLAECMDRDEAKTAIAQSLPPRLIMKLEGLLPLKCAQGLCCALKNEENQVSELEIHLHAFHQHQLGLLVQLAACFGNSNLKWLKIVWSSLECMAKFLNAVTSRSQCLETVVLAEDTTKRITKLPYASTWAALQSACQNMTSVNRFTFLYGRAPAIVYHVIHCIPETIAELNFLGCEMNLTCACELSGKLENSSIQKLDLSYVKLNSTEFVAILQGLKLCDNIRHLKLCGAKLDRPGVLTLADCIGMSRSLQCLDLSDCELNTDMCKALIGAIGDNRSLRKLILKNTKITSEGRIAIHMSNFNKLNVEGLAEMYIPPIPSV